MTARIMTPCFTSSGRARALTDPILIEIERLRDVCLLRLKGRLQAADHSEYLRVKMDEIRTLGCTKVLADFEDVPAVGSTGLSFIVGLYRAAGGRFVLSGAQPRVRKVLDVTGLSKVMILAPNVESGLIALYNQASAV
jgi:stage II sporulation protein AA (anti-sigma F factor antagonist)